MRFRRRRPPSVAKLRQQGDLQGLLAALSHTDAHVDPDGLTWDLGWQTRVEATHALSDFYGPPAAHGLLEALRDPHPEVRYAAVEGLAKVGGSAGIRARLDGVVAWEDPPYGEAAWRALETVAIAAVDLLPEAFADRLVAWESAQLTERHREALDYLLDGDPRGAEEAAGSTASHLLSRFDRLSRRERYERAETVLGWLAPASADRVIECLLEGRAELAAARAVGELGEARAVEPLIALLDRPDPELRAAAAAALGRIRDTRAVPSLLGATQDAAPTVRRVASEALDGMGVAAVIFGLAALGRAAASAELTTGHPEGHPDGAPPWADHAANRLIGRGD